MIQSLNLHLIGGIERFKRIEAMHLSIHGSRVGADTMDERDNPKMTVDWISSMPTMDDMSDWDRANLLRHCAAVHAVWGSQSCLLENDSSLGFYRLSASSIFRAFRNKQGGAMCGGMAYALMKLYHDFGYEAYIVDMGRPEYETHVVVLVSLEHGGRRILSIEDVLFDVSIANRDGTPVDYFEMLAKLKGLRHEEVKMVPCPEWTVQRDVIMRSNEVDQFPWIVLSKDFTALEGGRRMYRGSMSFKLYESVNEKAQKFKRFLEHEGYPRNMLYIYLFPFRVNELTLTGLQSRGEADSETDESAILKKALLTSQR